MIATMVNFISLSYTQPEIPLVIPFKNPYFILIGTEYYV